jgi:outer membrane biosynthesis protein TonB
MTTAVLSLTLVAAAPVYAQEPRDQQEEQKAKPEEKAQPAARQDEKNSQQQDKNTKQEEKNAQQQDKNNQSAEKNTQQQNKNSQQEEKNAQQQQAQRAGGNGGGGIPADRFKANFGREHSFRISQGDYSNRRFQYGGYSFGFVDQWPSNWLYTQDVFVVEINGVYYLCNPMYPGVNLALSFTM